MIELYANQKAAGTLASLGASGRMPHALLLEGPAGCGKKTAAGLVAQLALCAGEQKPCGMCRHCVKVLKRIHPDVRFYTVPEGRKEFPVDLVRQIRQDAYILPNEGNCKVYIIDKAHAMNAAAQNALLKILEEPPPHARFVLLCENRSLMLETVLSRVASIELEIPTVEQCVQALEILAPGADETERRAAASGSGGNIGRALELIGSAKPSKAAADTRKLMEALIFSDRYASLHILASYDKDREGLLSLFSLLKEAFAQLAVAHFKKNGKEPYDRMINRVTAGQAADIAGAVEQAARRADRNGSISLLCACMVEEIKGILQ